MNKYFSTYPVGLEQPIRQFLERDLTDFKFISESSGLVIYTTTDNISRIQDLRYLSNSFSLIREFNTANIGNALNNLINDMDLLKDIHIKKGTFRIVVSKENKMVSIANKDLLFKLEEKISTLKGLVIEKSKPQYEFWLLIRENNKSYFGIRLTSHTSYEKILQKGELRPDLCNILCNLSDIQEDDIFLDPFCGSGAIPVERSIFLYKTIFAGDIDSHIVNNLRNHIRDFNKRIVFGRWDALNLKTFQPQTINKIVTDPPWGKYRGKNLDLSKFYNLMLKEFSRVMRKNGLAIILLGRGFQLEKYIKGNGFKLIDKYFILVSGQKATIYKLKKS